MQNNGFYDERYFLWEDGPFFAKILKQGKKINYNFDIISIYYREGGVSTGVMSPKMKNDLVFFLNEESKEKSIIKGFRRRVLNSRIMCLEKPDTKIAKWKYRLKYLDVMVYWVFRGIDKKIFGLRHK